MIKELKQGAKAVLTGKLLENAVENYLKSLTIPSISYKHWINDSICVPTSVSGLLLKNVPYTSVYGGRSRGEFVLSMDGKPDVRIECRFQKSSGSVDEKLPFLFETAVAFEENIVILLVEGDGYRKGAKPWLKNKCNSVLHKKILMLNLDEFKLWVNNFIN